MKMRTEKSETTKEGKIVGGNLFYCKIVRIFYFFGMLSTNVVPVLHQSIKLLYIATLRTFKPSQSACVYNRNTKQGTDKYREKIRQRLVRMIFFVKKASENK